MFLLLIFYSTIIMLLSNLVDSDISHRIIMLGDLMYFLQMKKQRIRDEKGLAQGQN